jgi:hypothetical protein
VVDDAAAGRAVDALGAAGCPAVVIGHVAEGTGRVQMRERG